MPVPAWWQVWLWFSYLNGKLDAIVDSQQQLANMVQVLTDLTTEVQNTLGVEASAITALTGIAQRIQDAVNQALAGGATAADLAPVQAEVDSLHQSAQALAAAVAANSGTLPTPAPSA